MDNGREGRFVDWSIAARPFDGEPESGDRGVVLVTGDTALVAAVDGLGHGREAARTAERAVETVRAFPDEPLADLAARCHAALLRSRGAALSLARFDPRDDTVTWVGVGNVEGRLVGTDVSGAASVESLIPARGLVGEELPSLREKTLPIRRGDLVLLATDGIDASFADSLRTEGTTEELAGRILAGHSKPHDDALVVVARYIGRNQ